MQWADAGVAPVIGRPHSLYCLEICSSSVVTTSASLRWKRVLVLSKYHYFLKSALVPTNFLVELPPLSMEVQTLGHQRRL